MNTVKQYPQVEIGTSGNPVGFEKWQAYVKANPFLVTPWRLSSTPGLITRSHGENDERFPTLEEATVYAESLATRYYEVRLEHGGQVIAWWQEGIKRDIPE